MRGGKTPKRFNVHLKIRKRKLRGTESDEKLKITRNKM